MAAPRLLHVFANFVPGGSELRAVRLINAFGDAYRHEVVSMDGRVTAMDFVDPGRSVALLEAPPPAGTAATTAWLRRLVRVRQPDLVLSYGWGAFDMVIAAATMGLRHLVHHEDGFNADEARSFKRRRIWARRLALPIAAGLIVPSRRLEAIARALWWQPAHKIRLIANGIDISRFAPADGGPALRRSLGIPEGAAVVGTVANLRPEKNLGRLLAAVAGLPREAGAHLLIIGDGPERGRLDALAQAPEAAGRVHLLGHRNDPASFLRCCDVFALSSDTEQMPVSLLEAMACALPIAATDVGDVRAMLPAGQAPYLVPPDGSAALCDRLARLLGDRDAARRLGAENRCHVEKHYSFDAMLTRYQECYNFAILQKRITPVEVGYVM